MGDPQNDTSEKPEPMKEVVTVQPGHRVNYVMRDGSVRPFDIVVVWPENKVNGILLIDGSNDRENLPFLLEDESAPHITLQVSPHKETPLPCIWVVSVVYDDMNHAPGTWHLSEDMDEAEGLGEIPSQQEIQELRTKCDLLQESINDLLNQRKSEQEDKNTEPKPEEEA